MGKRKQAIVSCTLTLGACVTETELATSDKMVLAQSEQLASIECGDRALKIDPRRSLAVTDQPILEAFSFERVMSQLASQSGNRDLNATALFQQWWDTQNPAPGVTDGPHCDDELDEASRPALNGFPYTCRSAPGEGKQATCNPFTDDSCKYFPVGLFNRFDLADADGANCGEHRIVFAKQTGLSNKRDRNLVIFEASLPNPRPEKGIEGCREIAQFWADLSRVDSMKERTRLLDRFYFRGLGKGIGPVVDIQNLGAGADGRGQIRTNQFVQDGLEERSWSLREFKLSQTCTQQAYGRKIERKCSLLFVPETNKNNVFGPLFSDTDAHPQRASFQQAFLENVESLATDSLTSIAAHTDDRYNSGQSQASGSTETDYLFNFTSDGVFAAAIQQRLDAIGSELTPTDIVARAETQSCAGCHRFSNEQELGGELVWPSSLGFTHIDEREFESVDGVNRYVISDALTFVFLPRRAEILKEYLTNRDRKDNKGPKSHKKRRTLSASDSHG